MPRMLAGFWSYAREQRALQLSFHGAVETALQDVFGREPHVAIAIDKRIPGGHEWRRWIVESIARSTLFYLMQSPSAFKSEMCRFELTMFEAQVARIARHFSEGGRTIKPRQLWQVCFTPIRWEAVHEQQWPDLTDSDEAARIAAVWKSAQVPEEFDVTGITEQQAAWRGRQLAAPVRDQLYRWKEITDYPLVALLDFLAEDDEAFVSEWLDRCPDPTRPLPAPVLLEQRRHAQRSGIGSTRWSDAALGLEFVLVPCEAGAFWVTTAPLHGHQAADLHAKLGEGRRGANGHWLWSVSAAQRISQAFAEHGLGLPDQAQADALRALAETGPRICEQIGWRTPLHRFWWRTTAGLQPQFGELPLLLVKALE